MSVKIPLSQGYVALVSRVDAAWARQFNWRIHKGREPRDRYAVCGQVERGTYQVMHRAILERMGKPIKGLKGDHRNGDGLDNRRRNLRAVTHTVNMQNVKVRKDNTSGTSGVYPGGKGFVAEICANKVRIRLGSFRTKEEAVAARLAGEAKHWGIQPQRAHLHG